MSCSVFIGFPTIDSSTLLECLWLVIYAPMVFVGKCPACFNSWHIAISADFSSPMPVKSPWVHTRGDWALCWSWKQISPEILQRWEVGTPYVPKEWTKPRPICKRLISLGEAVHSKVWFFHILLNFISVLLNLFEWHYWLAWLLLFDIVLDPQIVDNETLGYFREYISSSLVWV